MNRITWIDNLRGLSVLAVIFLHSFIAVDYQAGHFTGISDIVNEMLAPVRLGLMFFVSGMFVDAGLKKGLLLFFTNKVKSILYPFVVWVGVYGGLKILMASYANHPQSALNVVALHLSGGGDITWFLHSLFIYFLVIPIFRHLPVYFVVFIFMFFSWYIPSIPEDSVFSGFDNSHVNKSLYLFVFFYFGDLLVRLKVDIPQLVENRKVLIASVLSFAILSAVNVLTTYNISRALLSPLAIASIPFFVWISLHVKSKIAYYIGVNSIVFYLSHYIVTQFFSKFIHINKSSLLLHDIKFISAFVFSLLFPWIICLLRGKGVLDFLFTLKRKKVHTKSQLEIA
jgi:Predicted membrane protein